MTRSKQRPAARKPAQTIPTAEKTVSLFDAGIIPRPSDTEIQAFIALTGHIVLRQVDDDGSLQRIVIPASIVPRIAALLIGMVPTATELRANVEALAATPALVEAAA